MSFTKALLLLSTFWALIHAIHHLFKSKKNSSLLPVTSTGSRIRSWNAVSTSITVDKLLIKIQTTSLNASHDALASGLKARQSLHVRRWSLVFYNFGVFFALLGMICALCILVYTAGASAWNLLMNIIKGQAEQASRLVKRGSPEDTVVPGNSNSEGFIRPIIPGVTVPLSHLPLIIGAVFICQLIHELGHLLSGALESVPMLSAGMSLTVVIPSAFVTFSTVFLDTIKPSGKLRIIAAGPWHNLIFWLLLLSLSRAAKILDQTTGVATVLKDMGWKDVKNLGRVVVDVDEDSPLKEFLPVESIVTKLDDVSLAFKQDTWSKYLLGEKVAVGDDFGWCVGSDILRESPSSCCPEPSSSTSILSCFTSLKTAVNPTKACLDPIPILTNALEETRCSSNENCFSGTGVCVRPDNPAAFLRLRIRPSWKSTETNDKIVLWNGPSREIWEQVVVSRYAPRFWFVPLWESVLDFWSYLNMATLSLFLFNLLPLPHLDGSQFLDTLLSIVFTSNPSSGYGGMSIDMDADNDAESGRSLRGAGRSRWKKRAERFVRLGTILLLGFSVLVGSAGGMLS